MEFLFLLLLILVNVFSPCRRSPSSRPENTAATMGGGRQGRAGVALELASEPGHFLAAIQVGITLIGILSGAFGKRPSPHPWRDVSPRSQSLRPICDDRPGHHRIGHHNPVRDSRRARPQADRPPQPRGIAVMVARPMRLLSKVAYPLVRFLSIMTESC